MTDFGTGDEAVYTMKSSIRHVNPHVEIDDIAHDVPLGNILVGASRLKRCVGLPTEPKGTAYVVVVDPGVGTSRKSVIIETKTGKYLIGPDNGVFSLTIENEGLKRAIEIRNREYTLLDFARSSTFHGKDVFAPVAAHILRGVPLKCFGPECSDLVSLEIGSTATESSRSGYLVDVDGFGSLRTNLTNHIPESAVGRNVELFINDLRLNPRIVRTFGEAETGDLVLVQSSTGCLDLAVVNGSASTRLGIGADDIRLNGSGPVHRVELKFANI